MNLTPEQANAVTASSSVAVTAGAGTGKTLMLSERYLHHLTADSLSPLEIVAVTFTERAAAELRARIRRTATRANVEPDVLAELEAAQISTMHALAARICRDHPDRAEVPHDFKIEDDLEGKLRQVERTEAAIRALPERILESVPFPVLRGAVEDLLKDPYTATRALACDPAEWPSLLAREKQQALTDLLRDSAWCEAASVMRMYCGAEGDKMESQRRAAVEAIEQLQRGNLDPAHLDAIDTLHKGRGSKRNWDEQELKLVKDACGTLKGAYRECKDLLMLELGEADEALEQFLPHIQEAYELVRSRIENEKGRERVLDFNDLELHALRALEQDDVRAHYRSRWKAFLIDEFQDTNPVQAAILEHLTENAVVTIVGDAKQSIYGFRRADVEVFETQQRTIETAGGSVQQLSTSFRTHDPLVTTVNRVFPPILEDLHQDLGAHRTEAPDNNDPAEFHVLTTPDGQKVLRFFLQRAEAKHVAEIIERLVREDVHVHDKTTDGTRPVKYGDIAILTRSWAPLDAYAEALNAAGIPAVHTGGGNLLEQREAKDAHALLKFLSGPTDNLALAAVLRGPYFAVSDTDLQEFARSSPDVWWDALESAPAALMRAKEPLQQLLSKKNEEPPSRLLQMADRLTGYTAVIANLPGGERRLADWNGFLDLIRSLESGNNDVFAVTRQLRQIEQADVDVARPTLEADNAVALMTIHKSKGLEWPIVISADLSYSTPNFLPTALFDAELGVGFKIDDDAGESQAPFIYQLLKMKRREREAAEEARVHYVALTRARDQLILTSPEPAGGRLKTLQPGLDAAEITPREVPFEFENAVPQTPKRTSRTTDRATLLGQPGNGLTELPVTALATYQLCPKRFKYEHLDGHPGAGEGATQARQIGILTHAALEHNYTSLEPLALQAPQLAREHVEEALALAERFRNHSVYEDVRSAITSREIPVRTEIAGLQLSGVIDATGSEFVLDFKTNRFVRPEHHHAQLWIYATAHKKSRALIAYLRHDELYELSTEAMNSAEASVMETVDAIRSSKHDPTPSTTVCGVCPYASICDESAV